MLFPKTCRWTQERVVMAAVLLRKALVMAESLCPAGLKLRQKSSKFSHLSCWQPLRCKAFTAVVFQICSPPKFICHSSNVVSVVMSFLWIFFWCQCFCKDYIFWIFVYTQDIAPPTYTQKSKNYKCLLLVE